MSTHVSTCECLVTQHTDGLELFLMVAKFRAQKAFFTSNIETDFDL